uniref:Uncharacterized protein n=1 Tax=Parascaris equorum TaxID=6256 RepID=A0A914S2I6_PAREQ
MLLSLGDILTGIHLEGTGSQVAHCAEGCRVVFAVSIRDASRAVGRVTRIDAKRSNFNVSW